MTCNIPHRDSNQILGHQPILQASLNGTVEEFVKMLSSCPFHREVSCVPSPRSLRQAHRANCVLHDLKSARDHSQCFLRVLANWYRVRWLFRVVRRVFLDVGCSEMETLVCLWIESCISRCLFAALKAARLSLKISLQCLPTSTPCTFLHYLAVSLGRQD